MVTNRDRKSFGWRRKNSKTLRVVKLFGFVGVNIVPVHAMKA